MARLGWLAGPVEAFCAKSFARESVSRGAPPDSLACPIPRGARPPACRPSLRRLFRRLRGARPPRPLLSGGVVLASAILLFGLLQTAAFTRVALAQPFTAKTSADLTSTSFTGAGSGLGFRSDNTQVWADFGFNKEISIIDITLPTPMEVARVTGTGGNTSEGSGLCHARDKFFQQLAFGTPIAVWDEVTRTQIATIDIPVVSGPGGLTEGKCYASPDGRTIAVTAIVRANIGVIDNSGATPVFKKNILLGSTRSGYDIAFSNDNRTVYAIVQDGAGVALAVGTNETVTSTTILPLPDETATIIPLPGGSVVTSSVFTRGADDSVIVQFGDTFQRRSKNGVTLLASGTLSNSGAVDYSSDFDRFAINTTGQVYDISGSLPVFVTDVHTVSSNSQFYDAKFSDDRTMAAVTVNPLTGSTSSNFRVVVVAGFPGTLTISPATLPTATVGQSYSVSLTASGGTGSLTWSLAAGSTPPAGLSLSSAGVISGTPTTAGTFTFTVRVTDTAGRTGSRSYSLVVNTAPVAANDAYSVAEDTTLIVPTPGVLANDTDADGNPLTAVRVTGPSNGSLTLNANGSFSYTPNPNFIGSDGFTYKANDGQADSNIATVTITVNPTPDLVGTITGPSRACPGQVIGGAITLSVRNLGQSSVGGFFVGVYISADTTITTSDLLLTGGREFVSSLGGNTIAPVPLFSGASVPTSTPTGSQFLGLLVDEDNRIVESNEANNGSAIPIEILSCPANTPTITELSVDRLGQGALNQTLILTGVSFAAGATVSSGAGITVTGTTVNSATQITVTLNVDAAAAVGARSVTVTNPGGLFSTLTGAFSVTPAPTITTITTDRNDFASCPPDSLTPCDPPLARDNTLSRNVNGQYVEIIGTGFQSGLSVDFGAGITGSVGLTVNAAGTPIIAGRVDVPPDAALGLRTVTLENGDGGRATGTVNVAEPLLRQLASAGLGAPPSKTASGTATAPTITSLTPNAGLLGTSVTIAGSNFGATTADNSVTFAGPSNTRVSATVNTASSTSLTVTVPAQAVDGAVTVAVNGLLSNTDKVFTVTNPRLSAVIPPSAVRGSTDLTLDLTGTKFADGATVAFNPATGITVGAVTFVNATNLRVSVTIASGAPLGLRDVTVTNPDISGGGSSTLPGAFEVKEPVVAGLELSLPAFASVSTYLPTVDGVLVTLDSTGRCTAKTVTPTPVTLRAQFTTTLSSLPTAPGSVTFTLTSSAFAGTATNEDCELGAAPTEDFSIGTASVTSQQVTVLAVSTGVYETTLYSYDWGGTVRVGVSGTMTLADGVTTQTVSGTLKLPVDVDDDRLPDVIEDNAALNANAAGVNVLNRLNPDQNGNGTRDGDDRFARDGLSNFEKYRGVYLQGPATPSTGTVTGAMTGPASVLRLGAGMRHLFVRGRGFGNDPFIPASHCGINPSNGAPVPDATLSTTNPCPPFEVGGAFAAVGVKINDVTASFTSTTVFPRRSLANPSIPTLDMATVLYDGVNCSGGEACDHTSKFGVRQWEFPTLGFSAFGTATAYSTDTRVFKRAVEGYFRDKPYEHRTNDPARVVLAPDGRPMLAPITLVGDSSSRGADNGIVDSREATVAGQLAGDTYIAGSFNLQLSAMDVTNDGCVELPFVSDPTTLPAACDPTAFTANPGPQATKRQVARSLTTHELGHAVGINIHTSDSGDIMYQYSINWTRDGHFSQSAADLIQIHNKGLQ